MSDFEVIDCREFQFHRGDLVINLKRICKELGVLIILLPDVETEDASTCIADINNEALLENVDIIGIATKKQEVLVKNKYGKVGILNSESCMTTKS